MDVQMPRYVVMCAATDEVLVGNIPGKREALSDARLIAMGYYRTGFDVPDGTIVYKVFSNGLFEPVAQVGELLETVTCMEVAREGVGVDPKGSSAMR